MRGKTLRQRIRILRDSNYSVCQAIEILKQDGFSTVLLFVLLADEDEKKPRNVNAWLIERVTKIMLEDEEDE